MDEIVDVTTPAAEIVASHDIGPMTKAELLLEQIATAQPTEKQRFIAALDDEAWRHLQEAFHHRGGGILAESTMLFALRDCANRLAANGFEILEFT